MNACKRIAKFKVLQILLGGELCFTIIMVNMKSQIKKKKDAVTQWQAQAGTFTTDQKHKLNFFLQEFSATKIVTWECHVRESTNSRYDMILGRDLLTALGMDMKFSDNIIIGGEGPYEQFSAPMVDGSNYYFNSITDITVKPEDYFINLYVDK